MTNRFERYAREDGRPANRFERYARPERVGQTDAYLRGLGDSLSLSWGDELMGVGAGLGAAAQGRDFGEAFEAQAGRSRANLAEARRDRPWETGAGELTGFLVPGLGAARVARTGVNLAGRLTSAGAWGAGFGGVSGAGAVDDDRLTLEGLANRATGGAMGAGMGAAFGVGAQGVLGELAPNALRAGRKALGVPTSGGRMGVAERARDDLLHTARQNERLNVQDFNDLGRVIQDAAAREPTMTVAEALGRSAINRVVKYSRLPGRTAEQAERVLERNADTFDVLTQRLDDTLTPRMPNGAPLTMRDASGELDAAFAQASSTGYQQAFANRVAPASAERMQQIMARHPEFYKRVVDEARIIAHGDAGAPIAVNAYDPRFWHYAKVAAGDMIRTMRREGLGATRARQYTQSLRQIVDELDQVPGYRDARQQWGSLSEAREALEAGFGFDKMRPAQMQDLVGRLTPFQKRYLQAGITERVRDVLSRRDNDGLINIARDLTGRRRSELLRAAFGDKRGPLDDFLQYARLRRQMHNDARRMASSQESPTALVTGEGLADAIPTGSISLRSTAARAAFNATIGRLGERNRDILGRVLLTPVSEFQRSSGGLLSRASREASRRQSRDRLTRTRGAYLAGVGGMGVYDPREEEQ